jgi:enolase
MILPVGAKNFEEAMQMGSDCYHNLKVNNLLCKSLLLLH